MPNLDHAEPAVGSQIHSSPAEVRIWFSEKLEPALSRIQVFDAADSEVDKRNVHVDGSNPALLEVGLPPLKPGKYKVVWRVVSVDTHATSGNFAFEVTLSLRVWKNFALVLRSSSKCLPTTRSAARRLASSLVDKPGNPLAAPLFGGHPLQPPIPPGRGQRTPCRAILIRRVSGFWNVSGGWEGPIAASANFPNKYPNSAFWTRDSSQITEMLERVSKPPSNNSPNQGEPIPNVGFEYQKATAFPLPACRDQRNVHFSIEPASPGLASRGQSRPRLRRMRNRRKGLTPDLDKICALLKAYDR